MPIVAIEVKRLVSNFAHTLTHFSKVLNVLTDGCGLIFNKKPILVIDLPAYLDSFSAR